jgi:hypothetical protein
MICKVRYRSYVQRLTYVAYETRIARHSKEADNIYSAESIERFIDDQAFSPSYDLAPPPPPPVSKLDQQHTGRPRMRDTLLTEEGGARVWGRSHIIQWRESLVLYKSFQVYATGC